MTLCNTANATRPRPTEILIPLVRYDLEHSLYKFMWPTSACPFFSFYDPESDQAAPLSPMLSDLQVIQFLYKTRLTEHQTREEIAPYFLAALESPGGVHFSPNTPRPPLSLETNALVAAVRRYLKRFHPATLDLTTLPIWLYPFKFVKMYKRPLPENATIPSILPLPPFSDLDTVTRPSYIDTLKTHRVIDLARDALLLNGVVSPDDLAQVPDVGFNLLATLDVLDPTLRSTSPELATRLTDDLTTIPTFNPNYIFNLYPTERELVNYSSFLTWYEGFHDKMYVNPSYFFGLTPGGRVVPLSAYLDFPTPPDRVEASTAIHSGHPIISKYNRHEYPSELKWLMYHKKWSSL